MCEDSIGVKALNGKEIRWFIFQCLKNEFLLSDFIYFLSCVLKVHLRVTRRRLSTVRMNWNLMVSLSALLSPLSTCWPQGIYLAPPYNVNGSFCAMALKVPFHFLSRAQSLKGICGCFQWDYCCWTNAGELQVGVCLFVQSSDQWLSSKPGARSNVAQDIDHSWECHHPSQEITWGSKEMIINTETMWTPDLLCILIAIAFTNSPSSPGSFVWGHGRG